jgi:hypothetical protein
METFTPPRKLAENPRFSTQKRNMLAGLSDDMIDEPIIDIVNSFNKLPCCFTVQCCYGHFVYDKQTDPHNIEPLPDTAITTPIRYGIAYICYCIEKSEPGRKLIESLKDVTQLEPRNIQFCSADWFWERQVNTYALQVMPDRYKAEDKATLTYREALHIEQIRNDFFASLREHPYRCN